MILTPKNLQQAGELLYGSRWQTDLAEALNTSSRTIRRWRAGGTIPDPVMPKIKTLLLEQGVSNKTFINEVFGDISSKTELQIVLPWIKEIIESAGCDYDRFVCLSRKINKIERLGDQFFENWLLTSPTNSLRLISDGIGQSPTVDIIFDGEESYEIRNSSFYLLIFPAIYSDYLIKKSETQTEEL